MNHAQFRELLEKTYQQYKLGEETNLTYKEEFKAKAEMCKIIIENYNKLPDVAAELESFLINLQQDFIGGNKIEESVLISVILTKLKELSK